MNENRSSAIAAMMLCAPLVASAEPQPDPPAIEAGLYIGGFISNHDHQFYDEKLWPGTTRPDLDRLSPQFGLRYAYFLHPSFGVEGEGSLAIAETVGPNRDVAKLYGLGVQAMLQRPATITPFIAAGFGLVHVGSNTLGSNTDWPIHLGIGARWFATAAFALRADLRFMRGPSMSSPYTLNASYGEFNVGVSWVPGATRAHPAAGDRDRTADAKGPSQNGRVEPRFVAE